MQVVKRAVRADYEGMKCSDIVLWHTYQLCAFSQVHTTDGDFSTQHFKVWSNGQMHPTSFAGKCKGVGYLVGRMLIHFSDTLLLGVVEYNADQIPLQRFGCENQNKELGAVAPYGSYACSLL